MTASITEQIECVRRELVLRRRVYPRWVQQGKMSQEKSQKELITMEAVLATLVAMENEQRLL